MILVFGKTGQVARELQRQAPVTALGREEADLQDPARCEALIAHHRPRAVINAAAYTAVDGAETDAQTAAVVNADAPGAMATACAALDIPFVHVSTDYVFDGAGQRAWRETDTPAPQGVYGQTKYAGEEQIRAAGGHWLILRTAWVFSAHGNNFVKTMLRLSQDRDQMQVVADQIGCPTPAADIAATLLEVTRALGAGQAGGLYHYAGQPPTSWANLARATFAGAGRTTTVTDIPTSAWPTPARRPLNSRLNCAKLTTDFGIRPPDWKVGLGQVLAELETE
ncbi:dTDP-4-dehydrorhamnose reductase [Sulfitobacter sp. S190]|uniref:dTDP-4-dehydrorhamnose reductase n=1 Tax=Sulfitobacter sp. S190 TaxID=2867022 RepID=UPI0021A72575|nr:dTDP-4-dehydrorhamnose reductase [Sulfitobacter sp. S190]UWR24443.1 dTDP-4-dehydrorhamnose reductase [Sulfitobacter sp. S190]